MSHTMRMLFSVLVLASVGAVACRSASALPNPLVKGIRDCAAEEDQTQRLACFDALAATLPKVEADSFGMTADIARQREPATQRSAAEPVLLGKIIALREGANGELVFTLDNGQVWMQAQAEPSKRFVLGEAVRIEHGAMGSLWLAADKARKTRVKRIT